MKTDESETRAVRRAEGVTIPAGRKWFTTAEVAALRGVTASAVRLAIRRGRLEAVDLNAGSGKRPHYRVTAKALRSFAAAR